MMLWVSVAFATLQTQKQAEPDFRNITFGLPTLPLAFKEAPEDATSDDSTPVSADADAEKKAKMEQLDKMISASVEKTLKIASLPMEMIIKLVAAETKDHPDPECVKGQGLIEKLAFALMRQLELVSLAKMKNQMIEKVLMKGLAEKMTNYVALSQRDRNAIAKQAMTKAEELERQFKQVQAERETAEENGDDTTSADSAKLKERQHRIYAELKQVRSDTKQKLSVIDGKIKDGEANAKKAAVEAKVVQTVMAEKEQAFQKVALLGIKRLKELIALKDIVIKHTCNKEPKDEDAKQPQASEDEAETAPDSALQQQVLPVKAAAKKLPHKAAIKAPHGSVSPLELQLQKLQTNLKKHESMFEHDAQTDTAKVMREAAAFERRGKNLEMQHEGNNRQHEFNDLRKQLHQNKRAYLQRHAHLRVNGGGLAGGSSFAEIAENPDDGFAKVEAKLKALQEKIKADTAKFEQEAKAPP